MLNDTMNGVLSLSAQSLEDIKTCKFKSSKLIRIIKL